MPMMTSQIFKLQDFTITQKPRCFENETSFPQTKKNYYYTSRANLWQKKICGE